MRRAARAARGGSCARARCGRRPGPASRSPAARSSPAAGAPLALARERRVERQVHRHAREVGRDERRVLGAGEPQRRVERGLRERARRRTGTGCAGRSPPPARPRPTHAAAGATYQDRDESRGQQHGAATISTDVIGRSPPASRRARSATIRRSTPGSASQQAERQAGSRRRRSAPRARRACPSGRRWSRARAATRADAVGDVVARLDEQVRAEHGGQPPQRVELRAPPPRSAGARGRRRRAGRARRRAAGPSATPGARRAGTPGWGVTSASSRSPTACGRRRRRSRSSRVPTPCLAHEPLGLDLLGDLAQRDLAQRREVLDLEEVVERGRDPLRRVDLAGPQPLDQRLGGEVDEHDLVGRRRARASGTVSRTRTPVSSATWSLSDSEVLDVDGGEDVDAGGEHVLDVLVALGVLDARRVGVGQLVDQARARGRARRTAGRSISSSAVSRYSTRRRGTTSRPVGLRRGLRRGRAARGSRSRRRGPPRPPRGPPGASGTSCRRRRPCPRKIL